MPPPDPSKAEAQLYSFVTHAPAAIAMFDREMNYLAASARWTRSFGRGHDSLAGLNHYRVHPDLPEQWKEIHRRGLAGESHSNDNDLWVRADGTRMWLDWSVNPWLDAHGRIGGLMILSEDITARKRAEESLRDSEDRYRQLVHALPAAVFTCDAGGRITLYNAAAVRLWGREPKPGRDRWCGSHRLFTSSGRRLPRTRCPLAVAAKTGEPIRDAELIIERPDGSRSYVLAFPNVIRDTSGAVTGAVNVLIDITALKVTENALRTSERSLRILSRAVEQSPASVVITDTDGTIDYVNPKFTEVSGYSSEEVLGKNPRLLNSGQQPQGLYREMWETITAGRTWRGELCNRKKNGELFWEFAVITPIQDEHGKVTHYTAVKEDITERMTAEQRLAESRQRLAGILESAMDAIITVDSHQRIVLFNAAAEATFRCTASEAIGGPIDRFIPSRFHLSHREHIQRFGEAGSTTRAMGDIHPISAIRSNGEEFPIDASISKVEIGGEKIYTIILRDITERRRLEQEVLDVSASEQRRIGQELHDDFCQWLAGAEFLASALAQDLAARSPADQRRAEKIAEVLRQALARARALAHGLTSVVIAEAGLAGALRELAADAGEMFGIRCAFDGPDFVQAQNPGAALHLYRIAQEAISNAVRHGRASEVNLTLRAEGHRAFLSIRDDGSGIAQPPPLTSGMGLRIMRYRAGVIGAALDIRTNEGGGTEIACTFLRAP